MKSCTNTTRSCLQLQFNVGWIPVWRNLNQSLDRSIRTRFDYRLLCVYGHYNRECQWVGGECLLLTTWFGLRCVWKSVIRVCTVLCFMLLWDYEIGRCLLSSHFHYNNFNKIYTATLNSVVRFCTRVLIEVVAIVTVQHFTNTWKLITHLVNFNSDQNDIGIFQ